MLEYSPGMSEKGNSQVLPTFLFFVCLVLPCHSSPNLPRCMGPLLVHLLITLYAEHY
ncbi:unnamed protein product [Ixodes pacificus]